MTRMEFAVVAACAETMFPPGGSIPISGTEAGIEAYADSYLAALPREKRLMLRALLLCVQFYPLAFGPRRTRFTRLFPVERAGVLIEMMGHSQYLRLVIAMSLRFVMTLGYWAHRPVEALIKHEPIKEVVS